MAVNVIVVKLKETIIKNQKAKAKAKPRHSRLSRHGNNLVHLLFTVT